MKVNLIKNKVYLLLLCSCIFLSFNHLPINIVYFLTFSLFLLGTAQFLLTLKIKKTSSIIFIFSISFLSSQLLGLFYSHKYFHHDVNVLSPLLFFVSWILSLFLLESIASIEEKARIKIYNSIINISILFFILELIVRVFYYQDNQQLLYAFKNSFFYFDSNFTGLVILSVLSLNIYIKNRFKVNNNKNKYILLILIVLTFSRSAIVASLILIIISNNIYKLKFRSYLLLLIITLVFIFMSLSYIFSDSNYQFIDGSLNSKFYIVEKAFIIYSEIPIENKLFGIGLGNTELFLNIFAHNILVTMLLEFGLIGSFLFILFIIYSLISSNHFCLLIWIPILIAGISLFGAYAPYLFIINAIIYFEESVNSNLK